MQKVYTKMNSEIKPFYSKTNVLITGATGLFGKLLIQKLLRTCNDINGIYLIIREKKGNSITERMEEVYKDAVFDKLKAENPEFSKKIHLLNGDCARRELGLSQANRKLLIEKINIVFHCAASVNLDAKMKVAVDTNVRGLNELLDLCHEMRYLKSLVFVSTAYSNCTQYDIEEKIYDTPIQASTLMKLTDEIDENVLDNITSGMVNKWPNTYCYTKAVAENMFSNRIGNLPAGVFRPTIVMPTYSDPVPGWTANVYGPVGAIAGGGLGIIRVFLCEPEKKFDFVPADFCINALICTAWEIHQKRQVHKKDLQQPVPVYNCAGGPERNIKWNFFLSNCLEYNHPLRDAIWASTVTLTSNKLYFNCLWYLLHIIPGYFMDIYLSIIGHKMRLKKVYEKLAKFVQVLSFFSTREWNIVNTNIYSLWDRLNETDKKLFPFNMDVIDQKKYLLDVCLGIKLYVLKEGLDNVAAERKRYQRLVVIHKITKAVFLLLLLLVSYKFIKCSYYYYSKPYRTNFIATI